MTARERWLWFSAGFFALYGAVINHWYLLGLGASAAVISALDIRGHRHRRDGSQP